MENLFAKKFPGLFTIATNGNYMLAVESWFTDRGRSEWIMQPNIFAVLQSYTLFKNHISFVEGIISFERAETNHDKVASPKQQYNMAHNLYKISSCVLCG